MDAPKGTVRAPPNSQESLGGVALVALVRLGASAFESAHAIFVAFARLEDFYRQGLD